MNNNSSQKIETDYSTRGGVQVQRTQFSIEPERALDELVSLLDSQRGVLLSSGYDYPGRYTRWDIGFVDPPLVISSAGYDFQIEALNARGKVLLSTIESVLAALPGLLIGPQRDPMALSGHVSKADERFAEEQRSRQPSIFSVLRALRELFFSDDEPHLGLYGAFGYDLCFQFEPITLKRQRPAGQRDLVLYLPDQLLIVDRQRETAFRFDYDFEVGGHSTRAIRRTGARVPYVAEEKVTAQCDHAPGEYAASVRRAKEQFRRGDLFELVLSQTFTEPCPKAPSEIFRHLQQINPAPYALFLNLGNHEYLVGASPEMYVRVVGSRVETCPISGTIPRGKDAVEDAEQIRELLISRKDESELTMCTDVDRNDKSRICEAGSVKVIGRRQIELYSRLIHTVDHVEGILRPEFDALDAFLSHTWAVTVTGAPKPAAIQQVETEEKSPRAWYGGAIGMIGFDGGLNTGLTLRTVRINNGVAEVRAGATLLFDSDPDAEEIETRVKASAFLDAIRSGDVAPGGPVLELQAGRGIHALLVDHQDSFVHTLANYLRQTGARVTTLRAGFPVSDFERLQPDMVVLSPGPGAPREFDLSGTIGQALKRNLPVFGVCLGLQGIVEYFGGSLGILNYPMHGKPSQVVAEDSEMFRGIASPFRAARYHSLFANPGDLPPCLRATARSEDGVIMAVEHCDLAVAAVQFHPESILAQGGEVGLKILNNAIGMLRNRSEAVRPKL